MSNKIRQELKKLDLVESEISIYLFLLTEGLSSPAEIAKGTGIARTNTYHILKSLLGKGLILRQNRGRRAVYFADKPISLLEMVQKKSEEARQIIPDLEALHKTQKNKPSIQFFDGWEEVKDLYSKTLEAEELLGTGNTEKMKEIDPAFFRKFQKDLKRNAVISKNVYPRATKGKTAEEIHKVLGVLEDVRFLPEKYKESPTDIFIWDDNIALISLDKPIFGTLVSNKAMADTFRMFFDFMWQASEKE